MRDDLFVLLKGLLAEELELYLELERLIGREEQCVDEEDLQPLLDVLRDKQVLISRQEELQERWADVAQELGVLEGREGIAFWATVRAALSSLEGESGYNKLAARVEEIRRKAFDLLERERMIQTTLETRRDQLRERLLRMKAGRSVLRGYAVGRGGGG